MKKFASIFIIIFLIFSGCTIKSTKKEKEKNLSLIFKNRKDAVFSPNGSVSHNEKAFSPDGLYYAKEIEPYDEGNIGIFKVKDNSLILKIDTQNGKNDLKGIAWAPDSLSIAVMFHGGNPSGISIYEIRYGKLLRNIKIGKYYHFMVFSDDGSKIFLSEKDDSQIYTTELRNTPFVLNSGFNLPWINYGWDIGKNPWGGNHKGFSSNKKNLEEKLEKIKKSGGKIVRVFIFCDLRSGIIFNKNNQPEKFDEYAFDDFNTLLNIAKEKSLKIIPVLFDYTISDGIEEENGVKVGEHPELFKEKESKKKLIKLFTNFFKNFSNNETIYAWDIINEPEHIKNIPEEEIIKFISDFNNLIHSLDKKAKTTLGCITLENMLNYEKVELDIFQFHYYDSFGEISPVKIPSVNLPVRKPVIIGEIEGTEILDKLNSIWENGYNGVLFWIDENFPDKNFYLYRAWTSVH